MQNNRDMVSKVLGVMLWLMIPILGFVVFNISYPNPPMPEIRYGEFPFRLEYEINGERIVIEDTVICEFDGVGWNEGVGKHRKWKSHLASNKKEEDIFIVTAEKVKIYCYVGSAEYYMNDERWPEQRPLTPRFYFVKLNSWDTTMYYIEEFIEKYGLKLISWEFTDPIVNTFK